VLPLHGLNPAHNSAISSSLYAPPGRGQDRIAIRGKAEFRPQPQEPPDQLNIHSSHSLGDPLKSANSLNLSPADAEVLLVRLITERDYGIYGSDSYEISISGLVRGHIARAIQRPGDPPNTEVNELLQTLWPVAWDFARRGILRPGVRKYPSYPNADALGDGYAITPFGKIWLVAATKNDFLPTEPGRFAQMLAPFRKKFGITFHD
jgi:hypothetical protein